MLENWYDELLLDLLKHELDVVLSRKEEHHVDDLGCLRHRGEAEKDLLLLLHARCELASDGRSLRASSAISVLASIFLF